MQRKLFSTIRTLAAPVIISGLLAAGNPTWAADNDLPKCTNRTLSGDYGFTITGAILSVPGVSLPSGGLPLRGVAMTTFDGRGRLTQVDHVVVNGGAPPVAWSAGEGTYSVNPNCTGTLTINMPGNPLSPVKLHFVVVRSGKEIRTVGDSGNDTSIGVKVD
jgi:hypothetical protein